jgi:class 3 adenylate cyclase/CHASE2 domain-containing sensor protein
MAFIMIALCSNDFMRKQELRLLDYRYVLREYYPIRKVPVSPDIALIMLDEKSQEKISDPTVFWQPYYGEVFDAVLNAGASAMGLDEVLAYADEQHSTPLAQALLPHQDKIVLIGYLDQDEVTNEGKMVLPNDIFVGLLGVQNIGLANLSRDLDGVARAQQVFPVLTEAKGASSWQFLAPLLAEKKRGQQFDLKTMTFGGQKVPIEAPDQPRILINYVSSTGQEFPSYSFYQVLEWARHHDEKTLSQNFAGKVVLMGPGSRSSQDLAETPFSVIRKGHNQADSRVPGAGWSMLGLRIQANILNTILTGSYIRRVSSFTNNMVLICICLLTAILAERLSVLRSVLFALGTLVAFALVTVWLFSARGVWLDAAGPLLSIPLVWGSTYCYRYAIEEKEKRFIRSTFGRYVSHDVMEELLKDPDKLKLDVTEQRVITVFFSDINGFTSASEQLTPAEVVLRLNAYFAEMTDIIFQHDGTIEKFVGDEIMVIFDAPRKHPDPEWAAVQTALDMVHRLQYLKSKDPTGKNGFYDIKVGIHTGPVILGNIGSAERMEYTCIGDTVNLASRIMNMTKELGGNILLSDATYEHVKGMPGVEFVYKDQREVRGRQRKIGVYEARRAESQP